VTTATTRPAHPPSHDGPATPTSRERVGTWQRLPAAPIPTGSYEFAGVWTGRELLLYGAVHDQEQRPRAAGAAYNPTTNTWRKLPPAPGPAENAEGGYTAVWPGTEMLGGAFGLNAAYNPVTNRWRELPQWATGTGSRSGPAGRCSPGAAAAATTSAPTAGPTPRPPNAWQQLPRGPLAGRHTTGAWTGTELIVAGGTGSDTHRNVVGYKTFADAAAYNPTTRTWWRLPAMPEPRADATATWTGSEVLVVGGRGPGKQYADGVAYNPASNRWSALPRSPLRGRAGHVAAWTGTQMLIWGGYPARQTDPQKPFTDGASYTPYPL
jgi:hypothetical protein